MSNVEERPEAPKPLRLCVTCRQLRPRRELHRVVRQPDGQVTLDPQLQHQGRGAYVCKGNTCLERALRKGGLARALKSGISQALQEQLVLDEAKASSLAVSDAKRIADVTSAPTPDNDANNQPTR